MHNSPRHNFSGRIPVSKSALAMSGVLLYSAVTLAVAAEVEALPTEEIFVTGTLIRGIEPTGSQVIGIDREAIAEVAAVTTNELLASVPQVSNTFNQRPEQDPRASDRGYVNRPNLHNLPGINSASGATTLLLVDGHRMSPMGVTQSSFDADFLPLAGVERVEIITDGGSSLYGADAVGGVINFITLKEFEGVKIDVDYGSGKQYHYWRGSITAGTSWGSGNAYISLGTTDRSEVLNGDRDWAHTGIFDPDNNTLTPDGTECLEPAGAITTWFWYGAGWTSNPAAPGAGTTTVGIPCDTGAESALMPEYGMDNAFFGLTQELADAVRFEFKAYYGERRTTYASYPEGDTLAAASPGELGIQGAFIGQLYAQSEVGFSYGVHPVYEHRENEQRLQAFGLTPELIIDLKNAWQLRNTLYYGRSDSRSLNPQSNRARVLAYIDSGALDPLNVAAADANVIRDILDEEVVGQAIQELFSFRTIADGAITNLPAGELRAAVGFEIAQDRARLRDATVREGGLTELAYNGSSRNLASVFAELAIPLFDSLDLSLSLRSDDYSDFGETTNPSVGFTFTPFDWLRIYGHWGESFNAPTLLDRLAVAAARYVPGAVTQVPNPDSVPLTGDDVFLLEGGRGSLLPQIAATWAVGFEVEPEKGLMFSVNYYDIDFDNLLGAVNPQNPEVVRLNPDKFIFNPTQAQIDEYLAVSENADQLGAIIAADVGIVVDRRIDNTDSAQLQGVDFSVRYLHDTGFGTLSYRLSGNKQIGFDLTQNANTLDQLELNVPDLTMVGGIGWSGEKARVKLTLKYTSGFDTDAAVNQTSVDSYLVTDLFVGYQIDDSLSLRFNVDNLFDEDPPLWRRNSRPAYQGFSLGRVFKLGFSKTFN